MVRLRSALACLYVFALLAAAISASAQTTGTNWNLISTPSTGPGISTHGTAPPPSSEPDNLYLLNGAAGVAESPLPQSIKDDLIPPPEDPGTVSVSSEEEDTVYIVGKEIVDGIVASEAAGALTPEIEAIAEPLDEETSSSSVTANGLFDSCATHERTTTRTVSLNGKTWDETFGDPGDAFNGTYSLTGQLEGSVTAELKYGIKRHKVFGKCVPYGLEFRTLRAFGNARSDGGVTLNGTLNYSDDSLGPWEIAKPVLFDVVFYVGPIPVRVILNMPITADLAVTANVAGEVNYNGTHVASGTFDYTCTLSTCTGSNNFDNTGENGNTQQITGDVEGRVQVTPHVDIGFRGVLYAEWFAYGQVGVRPHLLGDLWGYAGNQCGDADGDGDFETVRALTFDLDRRIDLTRESRVFNRDPRRGTIRTGAVKHVGFYDLTNSTAMQPYLLGPASLEVNEPGDYKVRMRPCWPYTDNVTYQLNWGDGSAVQEVQGAPGTEVTASHTWSAAGSKTVTATSARDAHGRAMDETYSRAVDIKVPTPLSVTVTQAPASATYGKPITLTATATGGHAPTIEYTLGRRRVGTADWLPSPLVFQSSNVLTWTPTAADEGSWELAVGVRDRNTPPDANTYGVSAYAFAGTVQVVAPLTVSCSPPNPATVTYGNPVSWTATPAGGTPGTIQYALSRQMVGTSTWIVTPWQPGNTFSWTPAAADVGTWQVWITVKDVNTPADPGYTASCNAGRVDVVNPLALSVTPSPSQTGSGNTITWTATATGGTPASTQYALFRRRAGATDWTPPVTAPSWQTSNVLSWTTGTGDAGTWEIVVWVRDGNTPANMNTYGYAAYANAGPVEVKAPLAVTITPSPAYAIYGNAITWTATATGGDTATIQYAFGRRRAGATAWIPDPLVWQSGNVLSWTPTSADTGSWEIAVGVRDRNTPAGANGYGHSAAAVAGTVQIVAPLSLSITPSPATSVHGNAITWTATASGGVPSTTRYAFFRRRAGTTPWTPDVTAPAWQTGNTFNWTPSSADVGTWEIVAWVKDSLTASNQNTYGYAAYANAGPVQVVTPPLTLTVTASPQYATAGNTITWTATAGGGTPSTTRFALFRRRSGATAWTPDVTAPAWQTSNVLSWTTATADVGTWEIVVWVKDGDTPASQNTYGYATYANAGPVQVVAPISLTVNPSPASRPHNDTRLITWTATASGGVPSAYQYAFFRRRAGAAAWTPDVTAPAWQTSNTFNWDPTSADVGTWETYVWVKDSTTPANMNTYGYAAGYNPGPVTVTAPLCLSSTASPAYVNPGTAITWNATPCGGYPPTTELALFRRRAGTTTWIPDATAPAWQSSNVFTWTPSTTDTGTWEILLWVRDDDTPPSPGYGATYNPGNVQVVAPLSVTGTGSPATSIYGNPMTWTATASGGVPSTYQYAFFRRRAGATAWTPDVTAPAWQASNVMSWTPTSADIGTWETYVWVKDGNTPANQNTYGYATGYNPGPVRVVAPLSGLYCAIPSTVTYGDTLTFTCAVSGGDSVTLRYAIFRRRVGTAAWTPDVAAAAWQTGNTYTWAPTSADVGGWEFLVWAKDGTTPANQNTYGYATSWNSGTFQVVEPISVTGTGSPQYATYGNTLTWTANASGGIPSTYRYAFFRRRAGATAWIPDVTAPAWQASNSMSWTPTSADTGTWEIVIWAKDGYTPANMNTYGYAAYYNAGPVQVVAPVSLTGTSSPSVSYYGQTLSWTANASGGVPSTRQYAFFRRRAGATSWTPSVNSPAWQNSNSFSWTPGSADTGTWEIVIWVRDSTTSPTQNGYGYAAYYNAGPVQVVNPPTVGGTGSPSQAYYGQTITWTANVSGGTGTGVRYAFFRRRAGDANWTPSVSSPAWQTSNSFSWTPTSGDVGTWEIIIWAKDSATPSNMNTYGYATYYNAGPVQVVAPAPLTVSGSGSPSTSPWGTTISWYANASGGVPGTIRYALFRRKAGTSNWIPDVTAPAWQSSSTLRWTPSSGDVGTWEIIIWVKDVNTSPSQNGYGYAAYYNAGPVQVY